MTVFAFSVSCDDQVASVARVFDVFAVLGHPPLRVYARRGSADYVLDVECDGLDDDRAKRIASRLEGLVAVTSVLIAPKLYCQSASER